MALLEVQGLRVDVSSEAGSRTVVEDVSFRLLEREVLALVGESGSGKSMTARAILRLLPPAATITGGAVLLDGLDLLTVDVGVLRRVRGGRIGLVLQDPLAALNPVLSVGRQIAESLRIHMGLHARAADERAIELLDTVGIPLARQRVRDYPHQFSGGMRQRAMIAIAIACNPAVLIADEPTTALDVTIQAQIIDLIEDLRDRLGMAVIWITHDLGLVARVASRVVVMRSGRVLEQGDVLEIFRFPSQPYTRSLLDAVPRVDRPRRRTLLPPV